MALQPLLAGLTGPLAAMPFMLSPAKTLDFGTPKANLPQRRPEYGVRIIHPSSSTRISKFVSRQLAADPTPEVVNLASPEYAKTVDPQALKARRVARIDQ